MKAALAYALLVFLAGCVLGAIRVLLVLPRLGAAAAVALEVPLILALSWALCHSCSRRFAVMPQPRLRLQMGVAAFLLLMLAELLLSLALGNGLAQHFRSYRSPDGVIGLAAQLSFALFPLLQAAEQRGAERR